MTGAAGGRSRMRLWHNVMSPFARKVRVVARETGLAIWREINLVNLRENILPTRQRADLILRKGADHAVETVALRKL